MEKLFFITIATLAFTIAEKQTFAQVPEWLWSQSAGGAKSDAAHSVSTDAAGNVYVTGWFASSSITFGSIVLTNAYSGYYSPSDIFITKYDSNGNVLWAKSAGGTEGDWATSLSIDNEGNVYITGSFYSSSLTFGLTTLTNSSADSSDIFITKYDSNGNVLWAKSAGGTGYDFGTNVTTDGGGNVYVTGVFDSDPITFGSTILTNAGGYDVFITKYNSNGTVLWAKSTGGTDYDEATSVSTDGEGNVYVTGVFKSDPITFGSMMLTNAGGDDIFITKYNTNGTVLWAKSMGGTDDDEATSVSTDAGENVYVTGSFQSSSITFGSTTLINSGGGWADIFITKYDSNGNVLWAKSEGGTYVDKAFSVATDAGANVYVTGEFYSSSITFGSTVLTNAGSADIFLTKYDSNGTVLWAKRAGGTDWDFAYDVSTYTGGNVYVVGWFESPSITFGSTILQNSSDIHHDDIFVAKLSDSIDCVLQKVKVSPMGDLDICLTGFVNLKATSQGNVSYQWGKDGAPIPGATYKKYHATETGDYYVRVEDEVGCKAISKKKTVYTSCRLGQQTDEGLISSPKVYPNPASGRFTIEMMFPDNLNTTASVQVINTLGVRLQNEEIPVVNGVLQKEIELKDVARGIYLVSVTIGNQVYKTQIVLQR